MAISLEDWEVMDPETSRIIDGDGYEWIIWEKIEDKVNPTYIMESYGIEPGEFSYDKQRNVIVDENGIEVRELNDKNARVEF